MLLALLMICDNPAVIDAKTISRIAIFHTLHALAAAVKFNSFE